MDPLSELRTSIDGDPRLRALLAETAPRLDDDPGHDLSHALRVALWTLRLVDPSIPRDRCVAAALLHDVVNLPKDSKERSEASVRSAQVASEILPRHGFEAEAVEDICDAVRDHSYSRGVRPTRPLGRALQDADRLEGLGALGIFRAISTGERMGSRYFDPDDPWAESRELDDKRQTVDHFFVKLLRLPETMNTDAGRREAELRARFMVEFLSQLGDELGASPPEDCLDAG